MNEEKIKDVFSDEEFVKSLMELETPEEVQKALEEKDIDLSAEDIKKIGELIQKKVNGELTDEELQDVAGGAIVEGVAITLAIALAAAAVGGNYYVRRALRRRW